VDEEGCGGDAACESDGEDEPAHVSREELEAMRVVDLRKLL